MSAAEMLAVAEAVRRACVLEVGAPKAGNVHRGARFDDVTWLDFVRSAEAVAPVLADTGRLGVGWAILDSVNATQSAAGRNTNLGIILLLAPLCAVPVNVPLTDGIAPVLAGLTVEDAALAFAAIRAAKPGGIGRAEREDVHSAPRVSLLDAMRLAANRDAIARQYANGFADVLGEIAADLAATDIPLLQCIVRAHLRQMAREPDSLIVRKCGVPVAAESSRLASGVLSAGWPTSADGLEAFSDLDAWLRADGNRRNPGTSADLIAAGLFVLLREGRLSPPKDWLERQSA